MSANPRGPSDEDDPIVAKYSVFVKPSLTEHRNLVVLQYVNKTAQDPAQVRVPRIAELRMKPSTGMYEVDIPLDTTEAYDKNKGVAWGTSLQKSMEAKKGGSLGLAGGFNIVPTSSTARGRRGVAGHNDDEGPLTWAEAARQDKVLRTQTFGGGQSAEEENTRHMIGVFQGKNLHLTPVSSTIHLRPVPHHIDASTEQERLSRAPTAAAAAAAAAAANGADKPGASAGRAIHMTIKSAMDADGGVATETMADRLRNVQTETWQRMEWVHDEAEMAWEAYNECLLLRSTGGDAAGSAEAAAAGKGKEAAVAGNGGVQERATGNSLDESSAADLVDKVSRLRTDWEEQELLQAVSKAGSAAGEEGIRNGEKSVGVKVESAAGRVQQAPEAQRVAGERAGRGTGVNTPAASSGTVAPRKSARRGATRGTAMEID